jgi:alpha-glucosidase
MVIINRRFRMAPRDAMGYSAQYGDPLYKHIPFEILLNKDNKAGGLLYDNYADCDMDMGSEIDNYYGRYRSYEAKSGSFLDCYYLAGPSLSCLVNNYTSLTGRPQLPPTWTLGYLGSSMTYTDAPYPTEALEDYVNKCKNHKIPATAFHLSSGYSMADDGRRFVFQWNKRRVPDPEGLCKKLHTGGVSFILREFFNTNGNYYY